MLLILLFNFTFVDIIASWIIEANSLWNQRKKYTLKLFCLWISKNKQKDLCGAQWQHGLFDDDDGSIFERW